MSSVVWALFASFWIQTTSFNAICSSFIILLAAKKSTASVNSSLGLVTTLVGGTHTLPITGEYSLGCMNADHNHDCSHPKSPIFQTFPRFSGEKHCGIILGEVSAFSRSFNSPIVILILQTVVHPILYPFGPFSMLFSFPAGQREPRIIAGQKHRWLRREHPTGLQASHPEQEKGSLFTRHFTLKMAWTGS